MSSGKKDTVVRCLIAMYLHKEIAECKWKRIPTIKRTKASDIYKLSQPNIITGIEKVTDSKIPSNINCQGKLRYKYEL